MSLRWTGASLRGNRRFSTSFAGKVDQEPAYWNKIGPWRDTSRNDFLSYSWQVSIL